MIETGLLMPIAERLRELRIKAEMTQHALAIASGLSLSVVTMIEQGVTPDPRLSTVQALARGLGCTLDDLAPLDDPAPPAKKRKPRK